LIIRDVFEKVVEYAICPVNARSSGRTNGRTTT
jgi:hypothetical protein